MSVDKSWENIVNNALKSLSKEYQNFLHVNENYFPNYENFLNAFKTLPKEKTKAILFGQDPYPREKSAIGYAFIDGMVENIFSQKGFSKDVNKATSLRNFLKMQLKAQGLLNDNISQEAISKIPKKNIINSIFELRDNFENEGILLLNRALVFTCKKETSLHVKSFMPFVKTFLQGISDMKLDLILFGNEAKNIQKLLPQKHKFTLIKTPHPYNISFINDYNVLKYFSKINLLHVNNIKI